MSDLIDRHVAISAICNACGKIDCDKTDKCEKLQLPPANSSEIPNSSDTISRAKAIDALTEYGNGRAVYIAVEEAARRIEQLPPTNCSEFPNNSDTISRAKAIEALDKRFDSIPMEQTAEILKLRKDLRELPSIQSEQKRGKWIYGEDSMADGVDGYRCDQCGFFVPWDYTHKSIDYIKDYNFCPKCGSYNEGEYEV